MLLSEERIDHVACGSAHTVAWQTINPPATDLPLPVAVPIEYNLLSGISSIVLRNRLLLLQHFSDVFCTSMAMLSINSSFVEDGNPEASYAGARQTQHQSLKELLEPSANRTSSGDVTIAIDSIRRLLISSKKDSMFKKVVQATMVRDKSHGPVVVLNRVSVGHVVIVLFAFCSFHAASAKHSYMTNSDVSNFQHLQLGYYGCILHHLKVTRS